MTLSATLTAPAHTAPAPEMQSDALIERLQWRYAAKKLDPAKAVSPDKV